jgi:hypothetical protein
VPLWLAALWLLGLLPVQAQRFAVIGDYGYTGAPERDVAALVDSWKPEFILTVGDNNYDVGDSATIDQNIGQYYHAYIYPYKGRFGPGATVNRFFPTLGNHDLYTTNGMPYLRYFTLPGNGRYYDFVRGNVHFFALNSDPIEPDGITSTSVQAQWLKQRLAAATEPWKVVYFHHAPYSSGDHGNTPAMQWPFKEWGASVVLAGHDHHYERLVVKELPYFVNGLGGRSIYKTNRPVAGSQVRYNDDYGAMLLTATPEVLTLQFSTRTGQLIDSYTLAKGMRTEAYLYPVVPTPFRTTAQVAFTVPEPGRVQLRVVNMLGQEVMRLFDSTVQAGRYELMWQRGRLAAGIYQLVMISPRNKVTVRTEVL